jgi:hypothetical protein
MNDEPLVIPPQVYADWRSALLAREPRALELCLELELVLPPGAEGAQALVETVREVLACAVDAVSPTLRELLQENHARYEALQGGALRWQASGNPNVLMFERLVGDERIVVVNNLTRVPQPVKFRKYAGLPGWDILNRIEFTFPARAQLEAYEFLWLVVG